MEISVNNCSGCPFLISDYDDYAVGFDTIDYCQLARFLKYEEDTIDIYNQYDRDNFEECDYCKDWYIESGEFDGYKCTCEELNKDKEISINQPEWCPLKKEDYIIK